MAMPPKGNDRRVQRTRQMIRQAFLEIVREKDLMSVSVQEITERANVSRGTFYAHYADKYALVELIVREEFQRVVGGLPTNSEWSRDNLRELIQAVLEFFKASYRRHHHAGDLAPIIDRAIHDELNAIILTWFKSTKNNRSRLSAEMTAQIISWAIFGAAVHWSQDANAESAEKMTDEILTILVDGVGPEMLP